MSQIKPSEPQVMQYETPPPTNTPAVLSLVFGIALIIPFVGFFAIHFGKRGLFLARESAAGREKMARAGIILGKVNLVLTLIAAAMTPSAVTDMRRQVRSNICLSNLRSIGMATMMYAASNSGDLPLTMDQLTPFLPGTTGYLCPAAAGKAPATVGAIVTSNYIFVPPRGKLASVRAASKTVLAYEPLTNHGIGIVFCDGHAERVNDATAKKVIAELQAGTNPPTALGP